MPRNVAEIVVGTGTLYTAPNTGTAEPAPTNPTTAVAGNWIEIGYSEEGWSFGADKTFENVLVAEEVDPVGIFKTAQQISISGIMSQVSLDNIKLVMAGGTIQTGVPAVGFDQYDAPATTAFDELSVLLRVQAPGNASWLRDIYVPRVVAAGAFQMAHQKAPQKATLGVEFQAVVPASGSIFTIIDQTA